MADQNASPMTGFPSVIDVPSFVDFMLLNELASNVDGYQLSTYFHKERNGKLRAGPIWDFNLAYGLDVFGTRSLTNVWQFDNGDNIGAKFWKDLFDNPVFKCYLSRRWKELSANGQPMNYIQLRIRIDSISLYISEASVREDQRWGNIGNYNLEISNLKTWIQTRTSWLRARLNTIPNCSFPVTPPLFISKINYNPAPTSGLFTSNQKEFMEITNNSSNVVDASGFYIREPGLAFSFPPNTLIQPNEKLYLASDTNYFNQTFFPEKAKGQFTRNLSNNSYKIILADPFGNAVDVVEYSDSLPWPMEADGLGFFLVLKDLNLDNALASSWETGIVSNQESTFQPKDDLLLYPNPSIDELTITSKTQKVHSVSVFDLPGKLVLQKSISTQQVLIQTKDLKPGIYLLQANFENETRAIRRFEKR